MKKFKYILISSVVIFGICFPAHFAFDLLQYDVVALFFPTNESIFQHMKMIFTSFLIFYVILCLLRKKFHLENIFLTHLLASISCITIFLVIYIPFYLNFGENMPFTFILLFGSILLSQLIASPLLKKNLNKSLNILSIAKLKNNIRINTPSSFYLNFFQHLALEYKEVKDNFEDCYFNRYIRNYFDWLESETDVEISALGTGAKNGDRILKKQLIMPIKR